ncbi:MAG: mannose-1-phosphate guanylyltransferase [Patescibacteria group bacterium]
MSQLYTLILAGGSGTRLWPLSRKQYPKQFIQLALFDGKSLFQKTLERALLGSDITQIRIVTNESYKFHCRSQAEEIGINLTDANLILEPLARNTLAAILLGLENIPSEADVLVLSSDHAIGDEPLFAQTVKNNLEATKDSIVLFGVQPASAHTGYGYIRPEQGSVRSKVLEFKEKPDIETAQRYVASGYLWNSGIFLFKKSVFVDQLRAINPAYLSLFESSDDLVERFTKLPDISVDVGLLEKSSHVAVLPFPSYWSDLGSFDALEEYAKLTNKRESLIEIAGANNFRISDDTSKPIVLIGMDNTIVVDTTDAILITRK